MRFELLELAKKKFVEGDYSTSGSYYGRARDEAIPDPIVDIHIITCGYMFIQMEHYSPILYFQCLEKIKDLANNDVNLQEEYRKALNSLLRFKTLFLRDIALNYFSEIAVTSWSSNYAKSINDLLLYLKLNLDNIIDNDIYCIRKYYPSCDLKKLKTDFLKVIAYCLNLMLMYTGVKSSCYTGKEYHGVTYDFGSYAYTDISSRDTYSTSATVLPRLHILSLEAYYDDYLTMFKEITQEINQVEKFSSPEELKAEITALVKRKNAKDEETKIFYKYSKKQEKDDPERSSYFKMTAFLNITALPMLTLLFGMDQVGTFNINVPFTRKKWLGVCNMLSWAYDWSIETTRFIMFLTLGLAGVGYLGLALLMKIGFYIPKITVKKP